jgi:NADP-dependent aldehyde dehydrogenase
MAIAAQRQIPIPVFAEMSSINPVYLFPGALDARAPQLARGFVASLTAGAGQFCTNPGLRSRYYVDQRHTLRLP